MDLRLGGMKRVWGGGVKVECVGLMRCLGVVSLPLHKYQPIEDTKKRPPPMIR